MVDTAPHPSAVAVRPHYLSCQFLLCGRSAAGYGALRQTAKLLAEGGGKHPLAEAPGLKLPATRAPTNSCSSARGAKSRKVDPVSGALSIIPGTGFNGAVIDPDSAQAVLQSLSSHSRAKVLSAPRILVNDNATGVLTSVSEVPYTSVNASQTVATTSFAGFAKAGTTIDVTPHIGEGDHVQLEYSVTLNSFTGTGSSGVPPPRQTDQVESKVVVPDGHTIIVGGLNRRSPSKSVTGLAYLSDVPRRRADPNSNARQCLPNPRRRGQPRHAAFARRRSRKNHRRSYHLG